MILEYYYKDLIEWMSIDENGNGIIIDEAPDDIKEKYKKLKERYDKYLKKGIRL